MGFVPLDFLRNQQHPVYAHLSLLIEYLGDLTICTPLSQNLFYMKSAGSYMCSAFNGRVVGKQDAIIAKPYHVGCSKCKVFQSVPNTTNLSFCVWGNDFI